MSIKVAASQFKSIKEKKDLNINKAIHIAQQASKENVNIFLLQELFQTEYFCSIQDKKFFNYAIEFPNDKLFEIFSNFCKKNNMVMPISFFEKKENNFFNSLVVINADGKLSDLYRKSHIPEGPGYNEKFYFKPGDTGFKVFNTKFGNLGCGICWDQWFPECARSMTLSGADILLYPTAIGSEPQDPLLDSKDHWQNVMKGHAAANQIPVIASNRIGTENEGSISVTFYGSSFIANHLGNIEIEMGKKDEGFVSKNFDFSEITKYRQSWGNFRDRRPDLYKKICDF